MLSLIYGTAQNCPDNFRFFRLDQSHALENGVVRGGGSSSEGDMRIYGGAGFVSSRNAPERRSCSFFDHGNAVPVLFDI